MVHKLESNLETAMEMAAAAVTTVPASNANVKG